MVPRYKYRIIYIITISFWAVVFFHLTIFEFIFSNITSPDVLIYIPLYTIFTSLLGLSVQKKNYHPGTPSKRVDKKLLVNSLLHVFLSVFTIGLGPLIISRSYKGKKGLLITLMTFIITAGFSLIYLYYIREKELYKQLVYEELYTP